MQLEAVLRQQANQNAFPESGTDGIIEQLLLIFVNLVASVYYPFFQL
jgi:hypothetical protein